MSITSQIGIFTTDVNLNISSWNDWLEEATGISEASVRGKHITKVIPDLEKKGLLERFRRVLAQGGIELLSPSFHHYLIRIPLKKAEGKFTEMQQRVTISPLSGEDAPDGLMVTLEDVTKQFSGTEEKAAESLLKDLSSNDWMERRDVAAALSTSGKSVISEVLRKIKYEHGNLSVLSSAMKVIAMSDKDVNDFLIEYLNDRDTELRIYSAQMLGSKNNPRVIEALIGALSDPDTNVRYHAIESLGKLRAIQAVEPLATIALEKDFFTSFPALDAIREIGDPRASKLIMPLIEDEDLGLPALEALAELGEAEIVSGLTEQINQNSKLILVVVKAIVRIAERYMETLGETHYVSAILVSKISRNGLKNLIACLEHAVNVDEIKAVITILGWIDDPETRKTLTRYLGHPESKKQVINAFVSSGQKVVDLLISQLNAADLETIQSAVMALGRIGSEKAVDSLLPLLKDDELAAICCGALSKIGSRKAFGDLVQLLSHPNASIRRAAIAALNSIGHPEMSRRIPSLLSDKNPYVRESALKIAGYFGFAETKPYLQKLLSDINPGVRVAAIENLPFFEDDRLMAALNYLYEDTDPKIRAAVVRSLGQMETKSSWKALEKALDDEDEWVRYYAVKAIDTQGYLDVMQKIREIAFEDKVPFVRLAAIEYLGHVGGQFSASVLSSLTGDENPDIYLAAINALGDIHHPDALPPLLALARAADEEVRKTAIGAIGRRGGPGTAEVLQWAAVTEKDPHLKSIAIKGLRTIANPEAIRSLLNLTSDPENRERAICALASLPAELITLVCEGLNHRNSLVRTAVVEVLLRVHTRQSSDMLASCLTHEDVNVRLATIHALHRLGNRRHLNKILELKDSDPDPVVKKAVEDLILSKTTDIT